jgi:hypothetical protein
LSSLENYNIDSFLVLGPINLAHAAFAKLASDFEISQSLADHGHARLLSEVDDMLFGGTW